MRMGSEFRAHRLRRRLAQVDVAAMLDAGSPGHVNHDKVSQFERSDSTAKWAMPLFLELLERWRGEDTASATEAESRRRRYAEALAAIPPSPAFDAYRAAMAARAAELCQRNEKAAAEALLEFLPDAEAAAVA